MIRKPNILNFVHILCKTHDFIPKMLNLALFPTNCRQTELPFCCKIAAGNVQYSFCIIWPQNIIIFTNSFPKRCLVFDDAVVIYFKPGEMTTLHMHIVD